MEFVLTKDNYFSCVANAKYMSVSRFKNYLSCEAMAKAIDEEKFTPETSDSLLLGSYVDAWNNGELEKFKSEHPQIISSQGKTKGELRADFKKIEDSINTLKNDKLCMEFLNGEKQVIFSAELFDTPWKICVDSYNLSKGRFVDLKCVKDFEWSYDPKQQRRVSFVEAWGYNLQMAIYKKIITLATGEKLTPYIVAVTKQDIPDKAIVIFDKAELQEQLDKVEDYIERVLMINDGSINPRRCNKCKYCRSTKVLELSDIKHHSQI